MTKRKCKKCVYWNRKKGCWAIKGRANPKDIRCHYRKREDKRVRND